MEEEEREYKSKSQMKRESLALQKLGEQLVDLSPDQLSKIEMPEDLREAVQFAKSVKSREGMRRQLQFIGALMRDIDATSIQDAIEDILHGSRREAYLFKQIEQWRDALVEGDEGLLDEIAARFPEADRQRLRQLAHNSRKEKEKGAPPKSSRALFRYIKELMKGQ